jgi:sugar-specific transcriptional regulator TrmB
MTLFQIEDSEYVQTLMNLGLTLLQAKVYLALASLGKSDVKKISNASNIIREEIYRVLPNLEKKGLVEKVIARPTLYNALPLREGLSILLNQKTEENAELQKKTFTLINTLQEGNLRKTLHEGDSQFIITSEHRLFRKRFEKNIQRTQTSVDLMVYPREVFEEMVFHHLKPFQMAMEKGVKMRALTEEVEDKTISKNVQILKENPFFELKCLSSPIPVTAAIYDNKGVNIRISTRIVPSLWSNNPPIVKLAASYFNELWNKHNNRAEDS